MASQSLRPIHAFKVPDAGHVQDGGNFDSIDQKDRVCRNYDSLLTRDRGVCGG